MQFPFDVPRQRLDWALIAALASALILIIALQQYFAGLHSVPDTPEIGRPPPGPPPKPLPMIVADISRDQARELNSETPFVAGGPGPAAAPLRFAGDSASRDRALDCLAAAMLYEAGDDPRGQYAVAQVVLNRARHPAFPSSVCGVVFQGSERKTGCQFTFTCDGALRRRYGEAAMSRTLARAEEMLGGKVIKEVGLATHYHTDWVRPYWALSLDKLAQVDTHIFYRWPGGWGGPAAMRRAVSGMEPRAAQLAWLFAAHRDPTAPLLPMPLPDEMPVLKGDAALAALQGAPPPRKAEPLGDGKFAVFFSPLRNDNVQAMAAFDLCAGRDVCTITGYLDNGTGTSAPVVFSFQRDRQNGPDRVKWDCRRFRRPTTTQCFTADSR